MTQFGSPNEKDAPAREERRTLRLKEWSERYLARIEGAYTRVVGSQKTPIEEERKMFLQAQTDPNVARFLYEQTLKRSKSQKEAIGTLLKWGQRMQRGA
jgi:hypothetical protein